jgi:hypothetical protein
MSRCFSPSLPYELLTVIFEWATVSENVMAVHADPDLMPHMGLTAMISAVCASIDTMRRVKDVCTLWRSAAAPVFYRYAFTQWSADGYANLRGFDHFPPHEADIKQYSKHLRRLDVIYPLSERDPSPEHWRSRQVFCEAVRRLITASPHLRVLSIVGNVPLVSARDMLDTIFDSQRIGQESLRSLTISGPTLLLIPMKWSALQEFLHSAPNLRELNIFRWRPGSPRQHEEDTPPVLLPKLASYTYRSLDGPLRLPALTHLTVHASHFDDLIDDERFRDQHAKQITCLHIVIPAYSIGLITLNSPLQIFPCIETLCLTIQIDAGQIVDRWKMIHKEPVASSPTLRTVIVLFENIRLSPIASAQLSKDEWVGILKDLVDSLKSLATGSDVSEPLVSQAKLRVRFANKVPPRISDSLFARTTRSNNLREYVDTLHKARVRLEGCDGQALFRSQ